MHNLYAFLLRNHFYILFLLLEILALTLLFKNHTYQASAAYNTQTEISGRLNTSISNITDYFQLKEVNRSLSRENARLRAMLPNALLIKDTAKIYRQDTTIRQEYTYTPAKVVHNSVSHRNNYLMLNKGSKDGIRPDMAIISPEGIVGIVSHVSENFCWAISVLHKQTKISARIKKNGFVGTLVWDGMDYKTGTLKDIPANVLLSKGDTVVTSGYSSIFPQGIMVGRIRSFKVAEGYNFYNIDLDFSQDYNKLSWAYIVTDFYKEEKASLEKFTRDE